MNTTRTPCQANPQLWDSTDPVDQHEAATACGYCPVRDQCEVLAQGEIYGVWAGRVVGRTSVHREPRKLARTGEAAVCAWGECERVFERFHAGNRFCSTACQRKAAVVVRREARGNARLRELVEASA